MNFESKFSLQEIYSAALFRCNSDYRSLLINADKVSRKVNGIPVKSL